MMIRPGVVLSAHFVEPDTQPAVLRADVFTFIPSIVPSCANEHALNPYGRACRAGKTGVAEAVGPGTSAIRPVSMLTIDSIACKARVDVDRELANRHLLESTPSQLAPSLNRLSNADFPTRLDASARRFVTPADCAARSRSNRTCAAEMTRILLVGCASAIAGLERFASTARTPVRADLTDLNRCLAGSRLITTVSDWAGFPTALALAGEGPSAPVRKKALGAEAFVELASSGSCDICAPRRATARFFGTAPFLDPIRGVLFRVGVLMCGCRVPT